MTCSFIYLKFKMYIHITVNFVNYHIEISYAHRIDTLLYVLNVNLQERKFFLK